MSRNNYWTRRISRRRTLAGGLAVAAAAGATIVGCGDDDDGATATPTSGESTQTGTSTPGGLQLEGWTYPKNKPDLTAQPKRGGKLTAMYNGAVPHLDPATTTSVMMHAAVTPVYNRLLRNAFVTERTDTFNPWDFFAQPDIAESWETPSSTEIVFKIRAGVKWQNVDPVNGRAFTAEDVVYSLNRYASIGLLKPEFAIADSIASTDASTVRIKLKEPNADFLVSPLGKNQTLMLPKEIGDADGDFQKRAVGTGPFIMTGFDKTTGVTFKKNPDYWAKDKAGMALPYLDEYAIVQGNSQAQLNGFLSGQVDLTFDQLSTEEDEQALLSKKSDAMIYKWQSDVNTYNLAFQLKTEPFSDVRVRRAFNMALNWDAINKAVFKGEGSLTTYFYPWKKIFDKEPTRESFGPYFKYDVAGAKKLLEEAGYASGFNATVEYNEYTPSLTAQLQIMQQMLKDVGINLELKKVEYTAFFEKWSKKSWESITLGFVPASAQTMDAWTYGSLLSGSPTNYWDINDSEIDQWVKQQHTETDEAKRKPIWKKIWDKELDQMWRLPTIQSGASYYGPANAHLTYIPTRYHNYWHYGGAQTAIFWRG